MEEEINYIDKNEILELVPRPKDRNVIGKKRVFRNKLDEDGQVTKHKTNLCAKDILG